MKAIIWTMAIAGVGLGGAVHAEQAEPNAPAAVVAFDDLPAVTQRAFEREAHHYIRVGRKLWSIEAWLRLMRIPKAASSRREPYLSADAPLFYDPVADRRARTIDEVAPGRGEAALVYGVVVNTNGRVAWLRTVHGLLYVSGLDGEPVRDAARRALFIVEPAGEVKLRADGDETRTAPAARVAAGAAMRKVTAAELAEYVQRHGIERFEQWRYRKVWDERPEARKVYRRSSEVGGPGVGVGTAEPGEVITNPGVYHYAWTRVGRRVPPMRQAGEQVGSGLGP